MKVKWDKLSVGDFFFITFDDQGTLLYQKITEKHGYNAVLLNTGELCQLYTNDPVANFEKTSVTFTIN